ncbi:hypothetical protein RUM43_008200 [Polyplax serrata]|uniref:Sterol regulatory element-binding protein cleavage-activating protein n=1 Tax=Polyplax serrata TaxID=468196 RepID=A0AAN8PN60_POLSC
MKRKKEVGTPPSERVNLPERVAHFYYSHGLLCSSHPILVLFFAISVILLCSYPLINLPLPGDTPIQTITDSHNFTVSNNLTVFSGRPAIYIQQVVLKTGVSPWLKELIVSDAFRAPLYQVFPLLETIRNFQPENSTQSLSNLCLHVETVKLKSSEEGKKLLPEYNCLILSPANFWQQNGNTFQMDTNLMGTIFNYHNFQKGKISLTELLFGVNMKESGLKRHPIRSRPRILQYAITLVLEEFDEGYISGLRKKLEHQYPFYTTQGDMQQSNISQNTKLYKPSNETLHVFYPGEFNLHELLPLATVFVILFVYIYFSLRKIEPVKSKLGIAFSAVVSIFSCLCMSMGLCFFFGLTVSLNGNEIFPYLVVFVGLENVLVITKSITNTPAHLDVKIRVAQGLSREGWSITKNLLIQVTILTIGFGTFVSAIQELCILGIVGLVCDFFLQLLFFTTVLSIDIHRAESNYDKNNYYYYHSLPVQKVMSNKFGTAPYDKPYLRYFSAENKNLMRSKSHHNLTSSVVCQPTSYPANVLAQSAPMLNKIPKRLRLVNIWASTRFFQRAFMVALVMWMCFILYTAKFVQQVLQTDEIAKFHQKLQVPSNLDKNIGSSNIVDTVNDLKLYSALMMDESSSSLSSVPNKPEHFESDDGDLSRFRHRDQDSHRRLSLYHWPVMMSLYNISLTGKFVTILPSIRLSHTVSPETATTMRNPNDKMADFQWKSLAVALDPLDFSTSDVSKSSSLLTETSDSPFIPRSPMEIALSCILVGVSVFVLAYMTMVLYRCICSRNYAEWRSSWATNSAQQEADTQVVLEAVPTALEGHFQEIECLISGGVFVISSCLLGDIRVWNSSDGDMITHIDRQKYFSSTKNPPESLTLELDHGHSDYESGSPPSVGEVDISCQIKSSRGITTDLNAYHIAQGLNDSKVYNRKKQKCDVFLKPNLNFSKLRFVEKSSADRLNQYKNGYDFETPYKLLLKEDGNGSVEELVTNAEKDGLEGLTSSGGECWTTPVEHCNFMTENSDCGKSSINNTKAVPPIWCMDCLENVIAVGCSDGQIEFWDCTSGGLQCSFDDGSHVGVTSVKLCDNKVVVARLNGSLDLLQLDSQNRRQSDWGFTSFRRTHVRTGSAGSALDWEKPSENMKCRKLSTIKAHQQPIAVLECESGRILTGSQDHTLKVFRLDDISLQYTLHGHCGPITCMFIDKVVPFLSGSGSHDGLLCFWDLLTGACLYSTQAHDGSICALTYSASYVISLGTDDRICVWERFLGHLLNTISVVICGYLSVFL